MNIILSLGVKAVFGSVLMAGATNVKLVIKEDGPMGAGDTAYERSEYTFGKSDGSVFYLGK